MENITRFLQDYWYYVIAYTVFILAARRVFIKLFKRIYKRLAVINKFVLKPLGCFKNTKVVMFGELIVIVLLVIVVLIYKL